MDFQIIDDLAGECHHDALYGNEDPLKSASCSLVNQDNDLHEVFFYPYNYGNIAGLTSGTALLLAVYKEHQRWLYVNFWFKVDVLKDSFQ